MKPEIGPDNLESMFRTTKRLFVVRLIDRSKGLGTEPLAAYKPQLRRSRPLWAELPPLSMMEDTTKNELVATRQAIVRGGEEMRLRTRLLSYSQLALRFR